MLSTIYLVMKTHGENKDGVIEIHMNKLKFYMFDVYNVQEIKWEELLNLLKARTLY